jgi:integrase
LDDPDAALAKYLAEKDALHAGRTPRPIADEVRVKDVANQFLTAKQQLLRSGELSSWSWIEYKSTCDLVVSRFGKNRLVSDLGPQDFDNLRDYMATRWGPTRLGNTVQRVRTLFKFALDSGMIDRPVRFGPTFKKPTRKTMRIHRAEQGKKLFTRDEILHLLDAAGTPLKAMLLLGINCGFGNEDCGRLPLSAVDLDNAVIDYPRPKTGIQRRAVLWPETIAALRDALAKRPQPKDAKNNGLVFLTRFGTAWAKDAHSGPVSKETIKLLKALGINGRKGLGFYTLRHTFRTVADESKDQPAVDFVMGHEVPHMSAVYRETISDDRLRAVTDHVRAWLFPSTSIPTAAAELDSGPDATV